MSDATDDDRRRWLERVAGVRRWSQRGERAPHKPLLMLYALGRLQRTGTSRVPFVTAKAEVDALLAEFGPANRQTSAAYPFHHLQTDGLWVVETADGSEPGAVTGRLIAADAEGQFAPDFEPALLDDPGLAALAAHTILDSFFPESMHADLCLAAGLDVEDLELRAAHHRVADLLERPRRDPAFRVEVLRAYDFRCALCGFDGQLGREAVGLEAAHIRWWAYDGADEIDNGLCLCSLHHKLFDRGAVGINHEHQVVVSRDFLGRSANADLLVLGLAGRPIFEPQPGLPPPSEANVSWHLDEVFRAPARAAG